jgi:hypothetical protein
MAPGRAPSIWMGECEPDARDPRKVGSFGQRLPRLSQHPQLSDAEPDGRSRASDVTNTPGDKCRRMPSTVAHLIVSAARRQVTQSG